MTPQRAPPDLAVARNRSESRSPPRIAPIDPSKTPAAAYAASVPPHDLPGASGELGAELTCALELARAAGVEVMKLRGGELGVELKPGDEPVTVADKRANELIVAGLAARFPQDPVISEELPAVEDVLGAPRLWLVGAGYAVTLVCYAVASKLTTAANAIFLQSTAPIYLLLLSPLLLREAVVAGIGGGDRHERQVAVAAG